MRPVPYVHTKQQWCPRGQLSADVLAGLGNSLTDPDGLVVYASIVASPTDNTAVVDRALASGTDPWPSNGPYGSCPREVPPAG